MRVTLAALITCTASLFSPGAAYATSILYGAEFGGSSFYEIDKATGSHTTIGGSAGHFTPGLAYNGFTNVLYTQDYGNNLYTRDVSTGTTTLVGSMGGVPNLSGLAFSHADSMLYAFRETTDDLYSVSTATGAATLVGNTGLNVAIWDLATNSSGVLYGQGATSRLYTLDTSTGAAIDLGAITGAGETRFTGIAFDEDDNLFGVGLASDALYQIDTATLVATLVGGNIGSDVRGLVFAFPAAGVPEPTTTALLALGLLGAGFSRKRRTH